MLGECYWTNARYVECFRSENQVKIAPQIAKTFAASLLKRLGLPESEAHIVATALIQADLEGVPTHGIGRLPNYVDRLQRGLINPTPTMKVIRERGATMLLDGDNGMGQATASCAMTAAIARAKEQGIGWVGVTQSNHFGAASFYCQMAVEQGMIGLAFSNSPPGVVPWGGKSPFLGTNPVAFGFPAGSRPPVLIDFATSVAARGQIIKAAKDNEVIPATWALDADGNPTVNPQAALQGALLPMGGPKGYALGLAVEILVGVLTGAAVGPQVPSYFDNWTEKSNVGHALVAIDISAFMDPEYFADRMEGLIMEIKGVPPATGSTGVLVPGERRSAASAQAADEGIQIAAPVLKQLQDLAQALGLPAIDG